MKENNNTPSQRNIESNNNSENLDATRLAKYDFTNNIPLDIMSDAQHSIAYYIDGYFSLLDAPQDADPFLMSISDHSQDFQKRRDEVMYRLMEIPWFTNENIKSARIVRGGILDIQMYDGKNQKLNLISAWNNAYKPLTEQQKIIETQSQEFLIQDKTREEERKLQDIVAKQAFYGGNVVLEYALGGSAMALWGIVIAKVGTLAVKGTTYVAKSMIITDEDGVKKRIHFKQWFVGTTHDFKDSIGAILRKTWYDYDPVTKKPYSITKRVIKAFGKDLENLKYEDFKKTPEWAKMSEQEFERFKQKAINSQQKMITDYDAGKINSKGVNLNIKRIIGEASLFFPFLASEYHDNQSAYRILGAVAGEWMFALGAKLGSKIPAPGPWKILTTVGLGGILAMGGATLLEKMDANRHVWLHTQKMNYRDERSGALHVTSFFWTEILGGANYLGRKITGDKNFAFDLGLTRTHAMNPITGNHLFTIPELSFYKNKVTMGTKPWEWLNASVGRGIEDWNDAVDRYKIEATEEIYEILGHYSRDDGIFQDKKEVQTAWWKEKLLAKELLELLMWEGQNTYIFMDQMGVLINGIIAEVNQNKSLKIPNSTINELIHTSIGGMKIDSTLFIEERILYLRERKKEILSAIELIPNLTTEHKNFLQKIPDRMLANEELYQNNSEKLIYEYLLKREDKITDQNGESISVGNYIADWLDQSVEWKHETKFIQKVKEWKWWEKDWTFL